MLCVHNDCDWYIIITSESTIRETLKGNKESNKLVSLCIKCVIDLTVQLNVLYWNYSKRKLGWLCGDIRKLK